jgi:HAD superfamily hydrolase (TIGR01509 family)
MRALIFDYDGLIIDSETLVARVVVELFADRGARATFAEVSPFVGFSGFDVEERWRRWLESSLGDDTDVTAFNTTLWERIDRDLEALELMPGVTALIGDAHDAGWRVGVGSGQNRARLERGLKRLGLHDRIDTIVTASDVGKGKPAPDIFLEVARRLGVDPRDCVVLEDSEPGCRAAQAAGMTAIACPCEVTRDSSFPDGVRVIASLEDLSLADL